MKEIKERQLISFISFTCFNVSFIPCISFTCFVSFIPFIYFISCIYFRELIYAHPKSAPAHPLHMKYTCNGCEAYAFCSKMHRFGCVCIKGTLSSICTCIGCAGVDFGCSEINSLFLFISFFGNLGCHP